MGFKYKDTPPVSLGHTTIEHAEKMSVHSERDFKAAIDRTRRELDEMGVDPDKIRSEVKAIERSFAKQRAKWRAKESQHG
jgi:hypothetical protein